MSLEIIYCRKCVEVIMEKETILVERACERYSKGDLWKLVEDDEASRSDLRRVGRLLMIALMVLVKRASCMSRDPSLRQ